MKKGYKLILGVLAAGINFVGVSKAQAANVTFQEGVNGYIGTQDKEIRSSGGDSANGNATSISIDGDDGSPGIQPNHGLIRFDNIIGSGANQIASQSTINSAFLTLNVSNPGSGINVYRMITSWNENSTWAGDFGGNGVTLGIEADSTLIASVGADNSTANVGNGLLTLNVTSAVQAWANGSQNFGLALLPFANGSNGIDFSTSEATLVGNRPSLSVDYTPVPEPATILGSLVAAGTGWLMKKKHGKKQAA